MTLSVNNYRIVYYIISLCCSLVTLPVSAQAWTTYQSIPYNIQFDVPPHWDVGLDGESLIASGAGAVFVISVIEDIAISAEDLFYIQGETLDVEFDGEYDEIELEGGIYGLIGVGEAIIDGEDVDIILLAAKSAEIGYLAYIVSEPNASDHDWDVMIDIVTSLAPLTDTSYGDADISEDKLNPNLTQAVKSYENQRFGDKGGDTIASFIIGNTMFTLYHELGHALIDQLGIPVLGREEDAADGLATILMISEEGDETADSLILEAAEGYGLADDTNKNFDDMAYWGEHSLDLQRYGSIHCLIYGSDPEGFVDLAAVLEMPESERARCPETYHQTSNSWKKVLAEHMRNERQGGGGFTVEFEQPYDNISESVVDLLRDSNVVSSATAALEYMLVLPSDIPVTFKSCDIVNAFYDPNTGGVTMCYELINFFTELIIDDLGLN